MGDKSLSSETELFYNREQHLRTSLQLVKIGPLYNCMGAFTTGTKNNSWYSSSGQEGRIHPGGSASNCRLATQQSSCLVAYNLDYQFIFGHFKRLTHKGRSHRCFKIWISPRYMIENALYLGLNTFLCFARNSAPFYA